MRKTALASLVMLAVIGAGGCGDSKPPEPAALRSPEPAAPKSPEPALKRPTPVALERPTPVALEQLTLTYRAYGGIVSWDDPLEPVSPDLRFTLAADGSTELVIGNVYSWPDGRKSPQIGTFRGRVPSAELDALRSYIGEHELFEHGRLDRVALDGVIRALELSAGGRTVQYRLTPLSGSDSAIEGLERRLHELMLAMLPPPP